MKLTEKQIEQLKEIRAYADYGRLHMPDEQVGDFFDKGCYAQDGPSGGLDQPIKACNYLGAAYIGKTGKMTVPYQTPDVLWGILHTEISFAASAQVRWTQRRMNEVAVLLCNASDAGGHKAAGELIDRWIETQEIEGVEWTS